MPAAAAASRYSALVLDEEIAQMRSDEAGRAQDFTAQFSRLQLSYTHYGDARYLRERRQRAAGLTADGIRALARQFALARDLAVVKVLPKEVAAAP